MSRKGHDFLKTFLINVVFRREQNINVIYVNSDGVFPEGQFPEGQFPKGQFPERTISEKHFSLTNSSPNDIFSNGRFPESHFFIYLNLSNIFFCLSLVYKSSQS